MLVKAQINFKRTISSFSITLNPSPQRCALFNNLGYNLRLFQAYTCTCTHTHTHTHTPGFFVCLFVLQKTDSVAHVSEEDFI